MRKFNRVIVAGALAVTMMLAPEDMAAAKTVAVVQTADGEQTVTYYDISFDANKGKKVKTTRTLSYKEVYGKLPKTTRTGYKFLGWYRAGAVSDQIEVCQERNIHGFVFISMC